MESFAAADAGAQPVMAEIRDNLLEPFIAATVVALGEMAGADVAVREVYQKALHHALGDLAVVVRLTSTTEGALVLAFPRPTAAALARRILVEVASATDDALIRDCVGEIGNVVAGQAKAMLAETPYRLVFSLPQSVVAADQFRAPLGLDCVVVAFSSALGEFALQLFLKV